MSLLGAPAETRIGIGNAYSRSQAPAGSNVRPRRALWSRPLNGSWQRWLARIAGNQRNTAARESRRIIASSSLPLARTVWNVSNAVCKEMFEAILADFAKSIGIGNKKRAVLQLDGPAGTTRKI